MRRCGRLARGVPALGRARAGRTPAHPRPAGKWHPRARDELSGRRDPRQRLPAHRQPEERRWRATCAHNVAFFAELACRMEGEVIAGETVDNHVRYEPSGVAALSHALERPADAEHVEGRPGSGRRQHRGAQAPPRVAPLTCSMLADGRRRGGPSSGGRAQRPARRRRGGGRRPGRASGPRPPQLHRLRPDPHGASAARRRNPLPPSASSWAGSLPSSLFADADRDSTPPRAPSPASTSTRDRSAWPELGSWSRPGSRSRCSRRSGLRPCKLLVGDPRDLATRIGPLIHPRQHERVRGYVERALAHGARVLFGGGPHPFGDLYYQPTCWKVPPRATRSSTRKSSVAC